MEYELSVDLNDLREGLKKFTARQKIRPSDKAILGFDGRFFSIEALDVIIVAKAKGVWPGIARIGASVMIALAKVPPASGPVVVQIIGDRLKLGPLTVNCEWQPVSHTLLDLPSAPDWIETLSLKYRAPRSQIISKGWDKDIARAERKLTSLITKVGKSLTTFGVTEKDIRDLIERRMAERYTTRT